MTDTTLTSSFLAASQVISESADELGILAMEMRVLVCVVEYEKGDTARSSIDTQRIGDLTHLVHSSVRKSLYTLEKKGLIEFVQKMRGRVLIVRSTKGGSKAVTACKAAWTSV